MPTDIVAQVLADWTLIGLVAVALLAFATLWCGLTGRLPSWYLLRRAAEEGDRCECCGELIEGSHYHTDDEIELCATCYAAVPLRPPHSQSALVSELPARALARQRKVSADRPRLDAVVQISERRRMP